MRRMGTSPRARTKRKNSKRPDEGGHGHESGRASQGGPAKRASDEEGRADERRAHPAEARSPLAKGELKRVRCPPYRRSRFWKSATASKRCRRRKSGHEDVGDPDLGIGDLPEQEVRDAQLAARADEEVGIGLAGRVEVASEMVASSIVAGIAAVARARRRSGGAPRR